MRLTWQEVNTSWVSLLISTEDFMLFTATAIFYVPELLAIILFRFFESFLQEEKAENLYPQCLIGYNIIQRR